MSRTPLRSLLPCALLALAACASGPPPGREPAPGGPGRALTDSEIEALYRARIEEARTRFSPADVHFMTAMIHHHAQAIEMARLAPANGASPPVRMLAARILSSQEDEIRIMQQWLRERSQPVPEVHVGPEGVRVHGGGGHEHLHGMAGMIDPDRMAALAASREGAFDRLFLTLMIEHHNGAVAMVHQLFATDGAARDETVFRFASDVQVDQITEVDRMERMLASLPPADIDRP